MGNNFHIPFQWAMGNTGGVMSETAYISKKCWMKRGRRTELRTQIECIQNRVCQHTGYKIN